MDRQILMQEDEFVLARCGADDVPLLTRFVFTVYESLYSRLHGWQGVDIDKQIEEDLADGDRVTLFAAFDRDDRPLGTIRFLERKGRPLPMEKDFGIDIPAHLKKIGHRDGLVVEGGRFARAQAPRGSKRHRLACRAMQAVATAAIMYLTASPGTVLYATVDDRVLALMRSRGFPFVTMAPSKTYLGSPTTPVFVCADDWVAAQRAA